jgi:hypothetical protein
MIPCRTCGSSPCVNPSFCAASRRADADRKRQRESVDVLRARRLLADDVSLERAWAEINDRSNYPTPQVTIEAILYCVRESGVAALKDPANVERLARCNESAKAQINKRIERLRKGIGT